MLQCFVFDLLSLGAFSVFQRATLWNGEEGVRLAQGTQFNSEELRNGII